MGPVFCVETHGHPDSFLRGVWVRTRRDQTFPVLLSRTFQEPQSGQMGRNSDPKTSVPVKTNRVTQSETRKVWVAE